MKKSILLLLVLVGLIIFPNISSYAQRQRLGIKPQSIVLDGNSSKVIEAYCFDRHIIIDKEYNYGNIQTDDAGIEVSVGGKSYSLSEAVKNKIIEIKGRPGNLKIKEPELVIEIKSLVSEPVSINVKKVSVFRDTPGAYKNQAALDTLVNAKGKRNEIQDALWKSDEDRMRLESLGYKSIEEFQKKFNLSDSSGIFDEATKEKLKTEEADLIEKFREAGVFGFRFDTTVQSVSDYIRIVQNVNGLEETGVFSNNLLSLIDRYKTEHLPIIKELEDDYYNSDSFVLRVKYLSGQNEAYLVYDRYGAFRTSDTKDLAELASDLSKDGKTVYFDLDFPSQVKIDNFKTSMNIATTIFIEGTPAAKMKFFQTGNITRVVASTPVVRTRGDFSSTITYKVEDVTPNQRMTVRAKIRNTVMTFVQKFKSFVTGEKTLAGVVAEAKKDTGSITITLNEIGNIRLIEVFPKNKSITNAE